VSLATPNDKSPLAPHILAVALVAVTAVLLCFGALVTTYDAAMAVPDWPGTYGHNMFLFPLAEWLGGPWDLFLEHGHRLLGATVGLLTLLAAAACFRWERRGVVRGLAAAAVLLVVIQGLLGGMRVLLDDRTIAKVHACTGPLFFGVAIAIAALTSRRLRGMADASPVMACSAAGLLAAAYAQLVAGAQLRHLDTAVDPRSFAWLVAIHLAGAATVAILAAVAAGISWARVGLPNSPSSARLLAGWATAIFAVVLLQILLGAAAWLVSWGVPDGWLGEVLGSFSTGLLEARSGRSALVVTGHVVLGMLIFGMTVVLAVIAGPPGGRRLEEAV
jgi:heme a synthase